MATQYKKIQNKIGPKEDTTAGKADLKPKASRDMLLLVLIVLTAIIMALAWQNPEFDATGRGMYGCLLAGMIVVYINRRGGFSDTVKKSLIAVSTTLLVLCIVLLGFSMNHQFFG